MKEFPELCRFMMKKVTIGLKVYYPSVKGLALIGQVVGVNEGNVILRVEGKEYYVTLSSFDEYAIPLSEEKAKMYVTQRIEDPENSIVYLKVMYKETWIDRLYNAYCRRKGRVREETVFTAK